MAGLEAVADASLGQQMSWLGRVVLELLAQACDVDAQVVGLAVVRRPPHLVQQVTLTHETTRVPDEDLEQSPLRGGQTYDDPVAGHPSCRQVDRQRPCLDD